MYDEAALGPLVDGLYEAMLEENRWAPVLTDIARALEGTLPTLFFHDTRAHSGSLGVCAGYDPKAIEEYQSYYARRNVWLRGGTHLLGAGSVRTSHMMCSANEYVRSEFYSDWCRPLGVTQGIGATIMKSASQTSNIAIFSDAHRADFGEDDIRFLGALLPHLQRALKVHLHRSTLRERTRSLEAMVHQMAVAVFLVSEAGRVVFMNRPAERLVSARDGLWVEQGVFKTLRSSETTRLAKLVHHTCRRHRGAGEGGGTLKIPRAGRQAPLEALVTPVTGRNRDETAESAVAAVYVSDPAVLNASMDVQLAAYYGLTPAQARVAALICRGHTARDAAQLLSVGYNTIKAHLKQIFAKTGVRSQAQLVRLISHRSTFSAPG